MMVDKLLTLLQNRVLALESCVPLQVQMQSVFPSSSEPHPWRLVCDGLTTLFVPDHTLEAVLKDLEKLVQKYYQWQNFPGTVEETISGVRYERFANTWISRRDNMEHTDWLWKTSWFEGAQNLMYRVYITRNQEVWVDEEYDDRDTLRYQLIGFFAGKKFEQSRASLPRKFQKFAILRQNPNDFMWYTCSQCVIHRSFPAFLVDLGLEWVEPSCYIVTLDFFYANHQPIKSVRAKALDETHLNRFLLEWGTQLMELSTCVKDIEHSLRTHIGDTPPPETPTSPCECQVAPGAARQFADGSARLTFGTLRQPGSAKVAQVEINEYVIENNKTLITKKLYHSTRAVSPEVQGLLIEAMQTVSSLSEIITDLTPIMRFRLVAEDDDFIEDEYEYVRR